METGIIRMTSADYHSDPAPEPSLSSTLAKIILRQSPLHAWNASPRLNPNWKPLDKKTFDIGRATHRAVLGAGDEFIGIPESILATNGAASTKEAKAFIADARQSGRTPLKQQEYDQVQLMANMAWCRLEDNGIEIDPGRSELAAIVQIDGVWCRAMFDNVSADPLGPIYDFKTCEDASPNSCLRSVLNYGYDVQAAHYQAVWKAVTGENRPFVFIFQEKSAPFDISIIRLSTSFSDIADMRAAKARDIWKACLESGKWPGYPNGVHEIDAPAWFIEREYQEVM